MVVSEKAVTLHPQSREVACELGKQTFEKKNEYFFWNILSVQKNVLTLQSVSQWNAEVLWKIEKQQKCSISTR